MVDPRGGAFTIGLGLVPDLAVVTEAETWSPERLHRTRKLANTTFAVLRTGDALVELYTNEKDTSVRKAVLNAFFLQGNARQLVEVARKETDPVLKREAVSKLALMNAPEAREFFMEILNKP